MKNDNMKKNGQFQNVRVEYGFGAVCQHFQMFEEGGQRHVKRLSQLCRRRLALMESRDHGPTRCVCQRMKAKINRVGCGRT